jgi:hypothetical protein
VSVTEHLTSSLTVQGLGVVLCMSRPEYERGDDGDECENAKVASCLDMPDPMGRGRVRQPIDAFALHYER